MSRLRAVSAALALAALLSACQATDNGNNTLAGKDDDTQTTAPATAPGAPQSTGASAPSGPLTLEAKDNEFAPTDASAAAGSTITVDNTGKAPHTFTVADLKIDVNVDAGKQAKVQLKGAKPGKYHFICKYHESLGMVGDLTVT